MRQIVLMDVIEVGVALIVIFLVIRRIRRRGSRGDSLR
jgi:hypothetical protein